MRRVAIIGGGVAGLVAARRLAQAGVEVTIFEASDSLGGMIQPARLGDLTIDIGAEAFAVRGGAVEALILELGLAEELVEPRPLGSWTYGATGARPSPAGGVLGIPSGPDTPGLAAVIGEAGVAAVAAEAALNASVGADAESFADLIRARFGELVLRRLVAPVTRGVYSLDPELVDHRVLLPGITEGIAEHGSLSAFMAAMRPAATPGALVRGLRGGMNRFVGALVAECERLGVHVELNTRVTLAKQPPSEAPPTSPAGHPPTSPAECPPSGRIEAPPSNHPPTSPAECPPSGRIEAPPSNHPPTSPAECPPSGRIEAPPSIEIIAVHKDAPQTPSQQSPPRLEVSGVLATVESAVASAFDFDLATPVSSEVVALLVDAPALDAHPRGTGVLVADATDVAAKALTHVTAKWAWLDERTAPGQHVVRLSYGPIGAEGPARSLALDDDALKIQALTDASRILGVPLAADSLVAFARREWRMPMPAARLGRTTELAHYRERVDRTHSVELCGTWIDGTGLASVLPAAERAADRLLADLTDIADLAAD